MLGTERFLSDGQRSLGERFRLLILPLVVVERCEVVEAESDRRIKLPADSSSKLPVDSNRNGDARLDQTSP